MRREEKRREERVQYEIDNGMLKKMESAELDRF